LLLSLVVTAVLFYLTTGLAELSGFHCMMRHSMRMNRRIHGPPQITAPPFQFQVLDDKGREVRFYEPGKVYTIRLVGFVHLRGLLLQSRLTNENGFLLGSLKGGRFIENRNWVNYGVRLQECDMKTSTADSVTHSDDSRKFLIQVQWTTEKDIGAVQFICENGGVCSSDHKDPEKFSCTCKKGWTGRKCESKIIFIEIDECSFKRCMNSEKCIDKWNDYKCICLPGWMGKNCDRPCQDIYRSCNFWKRHGQCELMRSHTDLFDLNCAVSCNQCTYLNSTSTKNRSVDYTTDFNSSGYVEILQITVADSFHFLSMYNSII
uniref:EGF-like domain-containing protein n=1 Tax=Dracunculus medinensis TaxID=318479 RepID=A0A158Q5I4_DRAME